MPLLQTDAGRIAALAPAKINLALHVTGLRDDGYHLIDTLAVFTEFGDRLSIASDAARGLTLTGPFGRDLETGPGNLVERARKLLRDRDGGQEREPVAIALEKNLPVASGIGGGSSDAAATMRALNEHWNLGHDDAALAALGRELGADVPMCIHARPLRARGTGEQIELVADLPSLPLVLVNPGVAVETPVVFKALANKNNPPLPDFGGATDPAALAAWLRQTRNDLQAPALSVAPPIGEALTELWRHDPLIARMSGSGATCFALFNEFDTAEQAAMALRASHPDWFVVASRTLPSPGDTHARHR